MKLTSVEIHPEGSSAVAVLSFRDPRGINPYNVKAIVGLDADEIVPRYYGASGDSKFYSLAQAKRELIIRIGLNPNFASESYSDLRDSIYKMIQSSRTGLVQVQFKNVDEVIAVISGFVKKLEAPHFEKTQEIQVTVDCLEPMLKALERTLVDVEDLDPTETVIQDDLSTAPHGFKFRIDFLTEMDSIEITDPDDDSWSFEIIPVDGFITGDELHFSSEFNNKFLYVRRGGVNYPLADVVTPGSIWPIMFPGENKLTFTNPEDLIWDTISYYPTYWGV